MESLYCLRSDTGKLPNKWRCEEWKTTKGGNAAGWWAVRIDPWEKHLVFTKGLADRLYLSDLGLAKEHAQYLTSAGADVKVVMAGSPPYDWDWDTIAESGVGLPSDNWDRINYDEPHRSRFQKGYPDDVRSVAFKTAEQENDLGWECLQKEDFRQALVHFDRALQACPQFAMVWNNKGWAHYRLGQINEAKNAYLKSVELAPRFPMPHLNLGVLYLEIGSKSEARLWFNKAIAADPNDKAVADYVRKIDWK